MDCMKQAIMLSLFLTACGGAAYDAALADTAPADAGAPLPTAAPDAAPPVEEERQCQTIVYDPVTGYSSSWGPCSEIFGD